MKTSAMKALLAKKRAPGLEQGDIQITVNQDGKETDGVDLGASAPPELTDPEAPIADQPEVGEVLDADNTAENDELEAGEADAELQEGDEAISAGEEAVEALEAYRQEVRRLIDSKMPVSQLTVEALHVGIESAMAKWNVSAAEMGIPSVESFSANTTASLVAMEQQIVASMEGIIDNIDGFIRKQFNNVVDLFVGVKRNLEKEKTRLQAVAGSVKGVGFVKELPAITNVKIIDRVETVTLDAKNSRAVLGNISELSNSTSEVFRNRFKQVEVATDKVTTTILNYQYSEDDTARAPVEKAIEEYRKDITNVVYADGKTIAFWAACSPTKATLLAGFVALTGGAAAAAKTAVAVGGAAGGVIGGTVGAGVGAITGSATAAVTGSAVGAVYGAGATIGVSIDTVINKTFETLFSEAVTKMPAPMRKKKVGTAVLDQIPALLPADIDKAIPAIVGMIDSVLAANADKGKTTEKIVKMIDSKIDAASSTRGVGKEKVAGNEYTSAKVQLDALRKLMRNMYGIESAMLRGARYSIPGLVDYVVESVKLAEKAKASANEPAQA